MSKNHKTNSGITFHRERNKSIRILGCPLSEIDKGLNVDYILISLKKNSKVLVFVNFLINDSFLIHICH
jgi:hypothetical protein